MGNVAEKNPQHVYFGVIGHFHIVTFQYLLILEGGATILSQTAPPGNPSFLLAPAIAARVVFHVVVQDEIQLLRREPVVPCQRRGDLWMLRPLPC
jgi:hypothetical protein